MLSLELFEEMKTEATDLSVICHHGKPDLSQDSNLMYAYGFLFINFFFIYLRLEISL